MLDATCYPESENILALRTTDYPLKAMCKLWIIEKMPKGVSESNEPNSLVALGYKETEEMLPIASPSCFSLATL